MYIILKYKKHENLYLYNNMYKPNKDVLCSNTISWILDFSLHLQLSFLISTAIIFKGIFVFLLRKVV